MTDELGDGPPRDVRLQSGVERLIRLVVGTLVGGHVRGDIPEVADRMERTIRWADEAVREVLYRGAAPWDGTGEADCAPLLEQQADGDWITTEAGVRAAARKMIATILADVNYHRAMEEWEAARPHHPLRDEPPGEPPEFTASYE